MDDMEPLLSVEAVARWLCLSKSKTYELMDRGELRYCRFGRSRRVKPSVVRAFIEASETAEATGKPHSECGAAS